MVEKYGVTADRGHAVGFYAGLLASLFPLAQCCSSVLWGIISDKTGRRPWLAFGSSVSAISSLLLGLCQTYPNACSVRFFGGLLNGTMTITKSTLTDLCDGTNQAKGFGMLNLAWGIGAIAGPVVSGLLAQPCLQYKVSSCPAFFIDYPFFLPCLSATFFSSLAAIASLYLKESNGRVACSKASYKRIPDQVNAENDVLRDQVNNRFQLQDNHSSSKQGFQEFAESESEMSSVPTTNCEQRLAVVIPLQKREKDKMKGNMSDCSTCDGGLRDFADKGRGESDRSTLPEVPRKSVWTDPDVLLSSFCYSMTGLIFIITDELFPMFGAAPKEVGGLGFSSLSIGIILGEAGVILFLYTLILYPIVAQHLGPLYCFRYGILSSVPLWLLFPTCSVLSKAPIFQWGLLLLTMAARSVAACTTFTGVLILVSNSATSANIGIVTGLSHSFCSFFRAVGPAVGGMIWSFASGKTFPLHQFLAWQVVVLLSLCTYGLSYLLPPSLVQPKENR